MGKTGLEGLAQHTGMTAAAALHTPVILLAVAAALEVLVLMAQPLTGVTAGPELQVL